MPFPCTCCGVGCAACSDAEAFNAASVKAILSGIANKSGGCESSPGCAAINGEYTLLLASITLSGDMSGRLLTAAKPGTYCQWSGVLVPIECVPEECEACDEAGFDGCESFFESGENGYESEAECLAACGANATCGDVLTGADWGVTAPSPDGICLSVPCEVECENSYDCDAPPPDLSCDCIEGEAETWICQCTGTPGCTCASIGNVYANGRVTLILYRANADDQVILFGEIVTHEGDIYRGEHRFVDGESNPVDEIACLEDWPESIDVDPVDTPTDEQCEGFTSIGLEVVA